MIMEMYLTTEPAHLLGLLNNFLNINAPRNVLIINVAKQRTNVGTQLIEMMSPTVPTRSRLFPKSPLKIPMRKLKY